MGFKKEAHSLIGELKWVNYEGGSLMTFMGGGGIFFNKIKFGLYLVTYTSDMHFTFNPDPSDPYGIHVNGFAATAIGFSYYWKPYFQASIDLTITLNHVYPFLTVYVPLLQTTLGVGFSPFSRNQDNGVANVKFNESPLLNLITLNNYSLEKILISFEYMFVKNRFSTIIDFNTHDFIDPEQWRYMIFDISIHLRPSVAFNTDGVKFSSSDFRIKFWVYIQGNERPIELGENKYLIVKGGFFLGFSLLQPDNSDIVVSHVNGFGIEIGYGIVTIHNLPVVIKTESFKLCFYNKFSEYMETYPEVTHGFRATIYI